MSAAHDDAHRRTRSWRADGQKGVIGTRRAAAYHDRVHLSSQRMYPVTRSLAADPLGVARARGDLAVQTHGPLDVDIRPSRGQEFQIRSIKPARLAFAEPHVHRDAGAA